MGANAELEAIFGPPPAGINIPDYGEFTLEEVEAGLHISDPNAGVNALIENAIDLRNALATHLTLTQEERDAAAPALLQAISEAAFASIGIDNHQLNVLRAEITSLSVLALASRVVPSTPS